MKNFVRSVCSTWFTACYGYGCIRGALLIAMLIGLQTGQASALIQSTFIAAGIATIVQTHFV